MLKVPNWTVISHSTLFVELLNTYWPARFIVNLDHLTPEEAITSLTKTRYVLVVIDLATVTLLDACKIQKAIVTAGWGRVVYLHYPVGIDASNIIHPEVTSGVFYCNSSLAEVSDGLAAIMKGKTIIPANILNEQEPQGEGQSDGTHLTQREQEVLLSLLSGSSNDEIAKKLFVCERTIRTHLYRTYKKIGVTSRTQAMLWTQHHLRTT